MLSLYDEIPPALWQEKGRTSTAINAPNILEYFGSLGEGELVFRTLNVCGVSAHFPQRCVRQRGYVWLTSHSMLLAIFGVHLFSRWNVQPFIHAVSHQARIAHSTSTPTASSNISTGMPYSTLLVTFSVHPIACRNVCPFVHIVPHKVRVAHSISFETGHCML